MGKMITKLRVINSKYVLCVSWLIYVLSLTQECFSQNPSNSDTSIGWGLLILGWIGIFYHCYVWIANPFLFLSWYCLVKNLPKISLFLSICSALFMLSFLSYDTILTRELPDQLYSSITGYRSGYWLWLLSGIMLIIGNVIIIFNIRK